MYKKEKALLDASPAPVDSPAPSPLDEPVDGPYTEQVPGPALLMVDVKLTEAMGQIWILSNCHFTDCLATSGE